MSPITGPLASSPYLKIAHSDGGSGRPLPMQELRPSLSVTADQLSERDREMVALVGRFRVMSGAQLRELFWTDGRPDTRARLARRSLARLARLEVLTPLGRRVGGVRAGSAGLTFAVGRSGQCLLATSPERRVRRPHTPGERHLAHTLAVAQLYVDLVLAQRRGAAELLAFDPEPDCWAIYPSAFGMQTLKPDAHLKLGIGEFLDSWFIEVDMATEAAVTILVKARRYHDAFRSGAIQAARGVFPRTAWIAPDEARADVLRGALDRLPAEAGKLFVVTTAPDAADFLTVGASA